jgi:hypothetical protein
MEIIDRIVLQISHRQHRFIQWWKILPRRYTRFHRPVGAMLELQGWQRRVADHT